MVLRQTHQNYAFFLEKNLPFAVGIKDQKRKVRYVKNSITPVT